MKTKLTKEELTKLLHERETELEELKTEIITVRNISYEQEKHAYFEGYTDAMKDTMQLFEKVFSRRKENE